MWNGSKRVLTPVTLFCSLSDKYPWGRYEPFYPPSYGLNSTTAVLLEGWLIYHKAKKPNLKIKKHKSRFKSPIEMNKNPTLQSEQGYHKQSHRPKSSLPAIQKGTFFFKRENFWVIVTVTEYMKITLLLALLRIVFIYTTFQPVRFDMEFFYCGSYTWIKVLSGRSKEKLILSVLTFWQASGSKQ